MQQVSIPDGDDWAGMREDLDAVAAGFARMQGTMVEMAARSARIEAGIAELRAMLAGGTPAPQPQPSPTPTPQPRRWLSGAGTYDPYAFGAWRGRPVEVWCTWNNFPTWGEMRGIPSVHRYFTGSGPAPFNRRFPGRMDFAQPLWAKNENAGYTARGDNEAHFQAIAKALVDAGHGNAYVRLGWEHTGDWFWWHATKENAATWKDGFRRVADIFRNVSDELRVVWCPNKSTNIAGLDARDTYPGDEYVDVVGVDWYNMWPASHSPEQWDAQFMGVQGNGSPVGLGAWSAFARSVGKPLALPEQGLDAGPGFNSANGSGDDPHYFTELHGFCADPANNVEYECVFNLRGENFQISPPLKFPRASAEYLKLWRPS